jgi:hypothetical protein
MLSNVVVSDDRRELDKEAVPARVIAVVMRVDQEAKWLLGHRPYLLCYARREVCELIVDDHNTFAGNREAYISAAAVKRIHALGELL